MALVALAAGDEADCDGGAVATLGWLAAGDEVVLAVATLTLGATEAVAALPALGLVGAAGLAGTAGLVGV
ncbi:hypothetical protein GCM10007857_81110 [Bradyrhizobium iriomotense]|uniref:Uncharacterized protein n=1 Tax=Bradyrhizobium iriomotense TaxID=441950 RepID=A0ABQ6BAF6_9BRAD|nr:hypothetical protein GCM10007857_81110 [Bradyrhizobium iriomotense]